MSTENSTVTPTTNVDTNTTENQPTETVNTPNLPDLLTRFTLGNNNQITMEQIQAFSTRLLNISCIVIPITFIPFIIFLYYHFEGTIFFFYSFTIIITGAKTCTDEVSLKEESNLYRISINAASCLANSIFILLYFKSEALWKGFFYSNTKVYENFWMTLWCVVQTDFLIKMLSLFIKLFMVLILGPFHSYHKGRPYDIFEQISDIYRVTVPLAIWIRFFFTYPLFIQLIIFSIYFVTKTWNVIRRTRRLFKQIIYIISTEPKYGKYVTTEVAIEGGNTCSICMGEFVNPIQLECNHIFCDACISEWFQKERTCPICRHIAPGRGEEIWANGASDITLTLL